MLQEYSVFFVLLCFLQNAVNLLKPHGVTVNVYDKAWCSEKKMESFLSVGKGSTEKPVFLELKYEQGNKDSKPYVFVGKYNNKINKSDRRVWGQEITGNLGQGLEKFINLGLVQWGETGCYCDFLS